MYCDTYRVRACARVMDLKGHLSEQAVFLLLFIPAISDATPGSNWLLTIKRAVRLGGANLRARLLPIVF